MPEQSDKPDLPAFYTKLMRETAQGVLKNVCDNNGITLTPATADQLCAIPVYEETSVHNLLYYANMRRPTEIKWATAQNFAFLPAYFKKYKRDDRTYNEIVVTADNYCHARFFAAKELMHCFLEDDGHAACSSIQEVNELIEALAVGGGYSFTTLSVPHIVDEVAWIGACEYLVPTSWLELLLKAHANITAQTPGINAYLHLAQLIRVPETILRVRLRTKW
jgi:hypothetical protein